MPAGNPGLLVSRQMVLACKLILGVWLVAVIVAGIDMTTVWTDQLQGAGQPGDAYIAIWQRFGLLVLVGLVPPLLAWSIWRISTRIASMAIEMARTR